MHTSPVIVMLSNLSPLTLLLHQDAKFVKLHPAAKKALVLLTAQVCHAMSFKRVLHARQRVAVVLTVC